MRTTTLDVILLLLALVQVCGVAIAFRLHSPFLFVEVILFAAGLGYAVARRMPSRR